MAVRAVLRARLLADGGFAAAVPDNKLYNAGAITAPPDLTKGKFAVIRYDTVIPGIGPINRQPFFVYVYDRFGAPYDAINAALERAKVALLSMALPVDHGDGHINALVWTGKSGDLIDDTWQAAVSFASFEVTYSGT